MDTTTPTDTTTEDALRAAGERLDELAADYEKRTPDWLAAALMDEVRMALGNLRHYIEHPEETAEAEGRVSWDFPFVELTYPVTWDFGGKLTTPPGGIVSGTFTAKDVVDGRVPDERVLEVLFEHRQIELLSRLTRGVVEWRAKDKVSTEGRTAYILPEDLVAWLDTFTGTKATETGVEGPAAGVELRRKAVEELARPFSIGAFEAEAALADARRADRTMGMVSEALGGPPSDHRGPWGVAEDKIAKWMRHRENEVELTLEAHVRGDTLVELRKNRPDIPPWFVKVTTDAGEVKLKGQVVAMVYPLVVDADARCAWFTVGVGLVFRTGRPQDLSDAELDELWKVLTAPDASETPKAETPETSTKTPRPTPLARAPQERVLHDSRVRLSRTAITVVNFLGGFKLPRKWDKVPTWEELVKGEVARIRETYGDAAFEPDPNIRGALLEKWFTPAGEEKVSLTKEAEENLATTAGRTGYRLVKKDPDRVSREYLMKRVAAGRGTLTLGLTWYERAFPLSPDARDAEEKRLREEEGKDAAKLFPTPEAERQKREQALALLGSMKDASRLAPRLLSTLYQQRTNPLRVPAWELYALMECENDPNRLARAKAAVETLHRLDFEYKGENLGPELSGTVRGSFVHEYGVIGERGEDVVFEVALSTWAVGCLKVFETNEGKVKDPRRVFYDWSAPLDKKDKKGLNYIQGFSALAPYYDVAAGLTPAQVRLRTWLENNLTLRKDAASLDHPTHVVRHDDADANEPRVYTSSFCPLLEKGRRYHAALGHYGRGKGPEKGRTLRGRSQDRTKTGGPRVGGLLEVLGYELPPGRAAQARERIVVDALKDMRAVVEEYLGGRLVGKHKGAWLTLVDAQRLRAEELVAEVTWFPFLPEDWNKRRKDHFEAHHRRRFEQGETDHPVRVTTEPAEVGFASAELRVRLRATRLERGLTTEALGKLFGVSRVTVSLWERGKAKGGAAIPEDLRPLVLRWIDAGEGPTVAELEALKSRRYGGKNRRHEASP